MQFLYPCGPILETLRTMDTMDLTEEISAFLEFMVERMYSYHLHKTVCAGDILDLNELKQRRNVSTIPSLSTRIRDDDKLIDTELWDSPALHMWMMMLWAFHYIDPTCEPTVNRDPKVNVLTKLIVDYIALWPVDAFCTGETRIVLKRELYALMIQIAANFMDRDDEDDLTPYERFAPMWLFVMTSCVLDPTLLVPSFDPVADLLDISSTDKENVNLMCQDFLEYMDPECDVQFEFVRILQHAIAFPGLREIHIYEQIFNHPEDSLFNKLNAILLRPNRTSRGIQTFQRTQSTGLAKFNYEVSDLIELLDESKGVPAHRDCFKLVVLHYYFDATFLHKGWFWKTVVPLEALLQHVRVAMEYSKRWPLFVLLQPYRLHLLYRERLEYGCAEAVIHKYLTITNNIGLPPVPRPESVPWSLTWAKWMPRLVNIEDLRGHRESKPKIIIGRRKRVPRVELTAQNFRDVTSAQLDGIVEEELDLRETQGSAPPQSSVDVMDILL
jgi:hypothetical protein